jgi:UDP-N-acetylglucosamine 2-epimerase (non-hydrolysing)
MQAPARLKVMTILGTRPEVIRLSRVIARLECSLAHVLVHTGQNYDDALSGVFFRELGLRAPDEFLGVGGGTLGEQLGNILIRTETVLVRHRPDAVLILGDTNSALAAIVARRMRVPVYHMEAGNRCFDADVPEEINRRIVDHIADFNLVYTEHARRHLLAEGLPHRHIYRTGSPMLEVLRHYEADIEASTVLDELGLVAGGYLLVSVHRQETVDDPAALRSVVGLLAALAETFGRPVMVTTHPRTRRRLDAIGLGGCEDERRVRFAAPFGFFDYNKLQRNAFCTLSDSGTISEEAAITGFPAVTLRNATERPEALDCGSIMITGLDRRTVIDAVAHVRCEHDAGLRPPLPEDYAVGNVSQRVVRLILGTARLSNRWRGIAPPCPADEGAGG